MYRNDLNQGSLDPGPDLDLLHLRVFARILKIGEKDSFLSV